MQINLSDCFPAPSMPDVMRGPLPKQKLFMDMSLDPAAAKYVAYYGGVGSGKSLILCITMLIQGILHGGEYVISRMYMPELKRTTYKNFLEICPPELIIDHKVALSEVHIRSVTGKPAIFYFVGLDEPDKLRSLNLSGAAIDEASQVSEESFLLLVNRLRNPKGLRKLLLAGNPAGHDWVYQYFVKKDFMKTEEAKAQFHMIVAPSTENTHLPSGYVESMLATYSDERIQREIMGSFDAFQGAVYPDFRRDVHVIKPFPLPKEWRRIVGIDHGYRNPSAWIWGAVDNDANLYIYREFYEREWLIEEIVLGKKAENLPGVLTLMGQEKMERAVIDPSTRAARSETGGQKLSDFDIYLKYLPDNFPLGLATNDVTAGLDRVKSYLKVDPRTKRPKLFMFDTCPNLIEEMSKYRYKELRAAQSGTTNEKEEPYKHDDHAVDALRYLIMTQPDPVVDQADKLRGIKLGSIQHQLFNELQVMKAPKTRADPFGD